MRETIIYRIIIIWLILEIYRMGHNALSGLKGEEILGHISRWPHKMLLRLLLLIYILTLLIDFSSFSIPLIFPYSSSSGAQETKQEFLPKYKKGLVK